MEEVPIEHTLLAIEGVAADPVDIPGLVTQLLRVFELFAQSLDRDDPRERNIRGAIPQSRLHAHLGMTVQDHLAHEELVEVVVQTASKDRIDVVVQVVDSALREIHFIPRF